LPLAGRVVTADALHCQRDTCQQILSAGGDSLVLVEANPPTLRAGIATLSDDPPPGQPFAFVEQRGRHGDRWDVRRWWASTTLAGYRDRPGSSQVGTGERVVEQQGTAARLVRYFITSLRAAVGAPPLPALKRGSGQIEHRVHAVRDVSLGAAAGRVRTGAAARLLTTLCNAV
jgi:predicted transposase YbfD/YdcC